jgi:hypothetical protein
MMMVIGSSFLLSDQFPPRDEQTPAALGALQKAEIEKWWPIIKAAGRPNDAVGAPCGDFNALKFGPGAPRPRMRRRCGFVWLGYRAQAAIHPLRSAAIRRMLVVEVPLTWDARTPGAACAAKSEEETA